MWMGMPVACVDGDAFAPAPKAQVAVTGEVLSVSTGGRIWPLDMSE